MNELANSYSTALFTVCEKTQLKSVLDELLVLETEIDDVIKVFSHPSISKEEKKAFIKSLKVSDILNTYLNVLIDHNRGQFLKEIISSFQEKVNDYFNIEVCTIKSVMPLKDETLSEIRELLSQKFNKEIQLVPEIDPSLIAGIQVFLKNTVIDNSIAKKLNDLKNKLR